jgi:hypothetical protein
LAIALSISTHKNSQITHVNSIVNSAFFDYFTAIFADSGSIDLAEAMVVQR